MAQKNNIRSIRFSDELAELIGQQLGDTFTAKFENLVTRCVWELPQKEAELKKLDRQIKDKREQLIKMSTQAGELGSVLNDLTYKVKTLESSINRVAQKWD